jgi:hypothetical protein
LGTVLRDGDIISLEVKFSRRKLALSDVEMASNRAGKELSIVAERKLVKRNSTLA